MKKLYMLIALLLSCWFYASAQNVTVRGTVADSQNQPIPGVGVKVSGSSQGTSTDASGKFTISAPANGSLVFTSVGFASQTVSIAGKSVVNVTLQSDEKVLETVVVTALGIERKERSLSYSTQKISSDDLTRTKDNNFVNSLAGKAAGLVVTRGTGGPGSSARVVLRGVKSFQSGSGPLYVIDGVPMGRLSGGNSGGAGATNAGDDISRFNQEDFESIQVLKGAAAAALYGSDAANGVILLTTKKGKAGTTKIDFASTSTFETPISLPKLQTSYYMAPIDTVDGVIHYNNDGWGAPTQGSDAHIKEFLKTGQNYINSISLSGGNDIAQVFASYANTTASGLAPNNDLSRHNINLRGTANFFKNRLTLDGSVNYMRGTYKNTPRTGFYMSPIFSLYLFPTGNDWSQYNGNNFEVWDPVRKLYAQNWPYSDLNEHSTNQNPYWIQNRNLRSNYDQRTVISFKTGLKVTNWLSAQARLNYDLSSYRSDQRNYATTDAIDVGDLGRVSGTYGSSMGNGSTLYADFLLTGSGKIDDDVSISATAGVSSTQGHSNGINIGGQNSSLYFPNVFSGSNLATTLNTGPDALNVPPLAYSDSESKSLSQALFGTLNLGYKETVFLDATARNEWSYTSPKSFFYPSVGLTYVFSETTGTTDFFSFGKIRGSYAEVGTPLPGGVNNRNPWNSVNTSNGNVGTGGTFPFFNGTDTTVLKPERTKAFEFGAELRFFRNKLGVDLTYYDNHTTNQIFTVAAPKGSGASSVYINGGLIRNYGFEGTVSYDAKFGDFSWSPAVNFSHNTSQIRQLSDLLTTQFFQVQSADGNRFDGMKLFRPADGHYHSFGELFGRVLQRNADGSLVLDNEGLPILTGNEADYVGTANPKLLLGFNNLFKYKQITLGLLIDSRIGGNAYSLTESWLDYKGLSQRSADARANGLMVNGVLHTDQDYIRKYFVRIAGGGDYPAVDQYRYSATNVRVRELSLGYTFPLVANTFKNLNISLTGRNLFFFYKDAPFDPEAAVGTGASQANFDAFGMPATRVFGFSVRTSL